ncbi:hypothetical protein DFQ30_005590 [Apophysomyces sp. BC1015]|nr:hypothetical protein DFQ30_005590 [Apophysomyces sp. BC1015]
MLHTGLRIDGPSAVRYPRGTGPGVATEKRLSGVPVGKGEIRRESVAQAGHRVAILAFGSMLTPSLAAAQAFDATVANMRFVKPLDETLVKQLADTHDLLVTVEEGSVMGGAGSAVAETLAAHNKRVPLAQLGLPDMFIDHGDCAQQLASAGLDAAGIAASIRLAITDRLARPPVRVT